MLKLWSMFIDKDNIEFLLLTNDDIHSNPTSTSLFKQFEGRITHMTVSRYDIPKYLAASDIGFMLRDDRNLNRVASPVKFPEYLSAGLAVVSSPNVGDVSELISNNRVGLLINPHSIEEGFMLLSGYINSFGELNKENFREKCRYLSKKIYTWEAYRNVFNKLYR
jgi:glycosyltransferase involved in cell wall biosynthesis